MTSESQLFTTYEYRSQAAGLFAEVSSASVDLQSCLAHLQRRSEVDGVCESDTHISVALHLYRRAFTGPLAAILERENAKLIGLSALSQHRLILDAGEAHFKPRVSFEHAKIGVKVRNQQIVGIGRMPQNADQWGTEFVHRWTSLTTEILHKVIDPELIRLELLLLNEVRLLGIQLVRCLPVLDEPVVISAQLGPQFCC